MQHTTHSTMCCTGPELRRADQSQNPSVGRIWTFATSDMESSMVEKSQVLPKSNPNSKNEGNLLFKVATLALLTLSFMVGEVAHFLPTVTRCTNIPGLFRLVNMNRNRWSVQKFFLKLFSTSQQIDFSVPAKHWQTASDLGTWLATRTCPTFTQQLHRVLVLRHERGKASKKDLLLTIL